MHVTSNIPFSVNLTSGITVNAINDKVVKGSAPSLTFIFLAVSTIVPICFWTSTAFSVLINPAMASGKASTTFPPDAITYPPCVSLNLLIAH